MGESPTAPAAAAGLVQLLTYEGSMLPQPTSGLAPALYVDDMRLALVAHPCVLPRLTQLIGHPGMPHSWMGNPG